VARVLIVDDEDRIRALVLRWLAAWHHEADEARNADEALTAMAAAPADVILIDITMPGRDGLWLLQQVHASWPGTAAVIMSGAQDERVILGARQYGAVAFVPKPIERELLRQALSLAATRLPS